ncbi:hypothetical protein ACWEGE_05825 [Amycolatopsis sp. NPDC004747]
MVAGYIDKIKLDPWSAADWVRFPNAREVEIVKKAQFTVLAPQLHPQTDRAVDAVYAVDTRGTGRCPHRRATDDPAPGGESRAGGEGNRDGRGRGRPRRQPSRPAPDGDVAMSPGRATTAVTGPDQPQITQQMRAAATACEDEAAGERFTGDREVLVWARARLAEVAAVCRALAAALGTDPTVATEPGRLAAAAGADVELAGGCSGCCAPRSPRQGPGTAAPNPGSWPSGAPKSTPSPPVSGSWPPGPRS